MLAKSIPQLKHLNNMFYFIVNKSYVYYIECLKKNTRLAGLYAEILQRGGVNLGYLKKEGAQLQAASGGALEDNVKN